MKSDRYLDAVQFITGTETNAQTRLGLSGETFAGVQEMFAGLLSGGAVGAVGAIAYIGLRAFLGWCFSG